jgi:hypothetical protein
MLICVMGCSGGGGGFAPSLPVAACVRLGYSGLAGRLAPTGMPISGTGCCCGGGNVAPSPPVAAACVRLGYSGPACSSTTDLCGWWNISLSFISHTTCS